MILEILDIIYKKLNNKEISETLREIEIFMDEYGVSDKMERNLPLLFEEIMLCIRKKISRSRIYPKDKKKNLSFVICQDRNKM